MFEKIREINCEQENFSMYNAILIQKTFVVRLIVMQQLEKKKNKEKNF
jgi:hypothetical protein